MKIYLYILYYIIIYFMNCISISYIKCETSVTEHAARYLLPLAVTK